MRQYDGQDGERRGPSYQERHGHRKGAAIKKVSGDGDGNWKIGVKSEVRTQLTEIKRALHQKPLQTGAIRLNSGSFRPEEPGTFGLLGALQLQQVRLER